MTDPARKALAGTIGNRLLSPLPRGNEALSVLQQLAKGDSSILASHGFDEPALELLRAGAAAEAVVRARISSLDAKLRAFTERLARWDESDRPSLEDVLASPLVGDPEAQDPGS